MMRILVAGIVVGACLFTVRSTFAESTTPPSLLARPSAIPGPAFGLCAVIGYKDGGPIYVPGEPLLSVHRVKDISYDAKAAEYRIFLLPADAKKLAKVTRQHREEIIAVTADNRVIARWIFSAPVTDGILRISSSAKMEYVLKAFAEEIREFHKQK